MSGICCAASACRSTPCPAGPETAVEGDSLSPAAPFRVVNIGNSDKVRLLDFIEAIEAAVPSASMRACKPAT
jgi:UDP-glucuronate 4-epimerase